jgi:hypothetical protein
LATWSSFSASLKSAIDPLVGLLVEAIFGALGSLMYQSVLPDGALQERDWPAGDGVFLHERQQQLAG